MKFCIFLLVFVAAIIIGECSHTFMGTSVYKQVVYHRKAVYLPKVMRKRVETIKYTIPPSYGYGRSIQGILAIDLINNGASANVTSGGVGYPYMTLRMKSPRGKPMRFDVYLYA